MTTFRKLNVSIGNLAIVVGNVMAASGKTCTIVSYEGAIFHPQLNKTFADCWMCHFPTPQVALRRAIQHDIIIPDEYLRKIAGDDCVDESENETFIGEMYEEIIGGTL